MWRRAAATLGVLTLAACGAAQAPDPWWDQVEPAGPCWRVDLADGLDQASTDELHDLYTCLNQSGNFDALGGVVDAMDEPSRDGRPLGVELAILLEAATHTDLDLFALAGVGVDLLQSEDRPIEPLLEIAVELIYGVSYADVVAGVPLASTSAMDGGVLRPLLPVLGNAAEAILDDGDTIPTLAADALTGDTLPDAVCTLVAFEDATDSDIQELGDRLLPDIGTAITEARDASNDRWSDASGDSIRDLVDALIVDTAGDGRSALSAISDDLRPLIADDEVRDRVADLLADQGEAGRLEELPLWALHLASVDVDGTRLCGAGTTSGCSTGDSALVALIRLLAASNTDVSCSVLGISVYNGNMAYDLLVLLADLDPDTVVDISDLAGTLLGWSFSDDVLDYVLGYCDGLDDPSQVVADLGSLDRLNDSASGELIKVLIDALGAIYDPGIGLDHLDGLLGLIEVAHARDVIPPVEEALRDLASSVAIGDVVGLLPILLDPRDLDATRCPTGSAPLDFDGIWALLGDALEPDERDRTVLDDLQPVLNAALGHEGTWTAIGNLGALLQDTNARVQDLPQVMTALIAVDPELGLLDDVAALLRDEALTDPALRMAESDALMDAVGYSELSAEGPMPFGARLVTGGTLETVLHTVDIALSALED